MRKSRGKDTKKPTLQLDAELLKFLAGAFGFGFFLLGYSYTHSFFRSFGLSIFDIELHWLDIIFRGIALLEVPTVWMTCLGLAALLAILWEIRVHMGGLVGALASLLIAITLVWGALAGGKSVGVQNAKEVWGGGAGKKVWCRFSAAVEQQQPSFSKRFYDLAVQERLRLLHANNRYIYIAPVLEIIPKGQNVGESYAIRKNSIAYCRVVGSQSDSNELGLGSDDV